MFCCPIFVWNLSSSLNLVYTSYKFVYQNTVVLLWWKLVWKWKRGNQETDIQIDRQRMTREYTIKKRHGMCVCTLWKSVKHSLHADEIDKLYFFYSFFFLVFCLWTQNERSCFQFIVKLFTIFKKIRDWEKHKREYEYENGISQCNGFLFWKISQILNVKSSWIYIE